MKDTDTVLMVPPAGMHNTRHRTFKKKDYNSF